MPDLVAHAQLLSCSTIYLQQYTYNVTCCFSADTMPFQNCVLLLAPYTV